MHQAAISPPQRFPCGKRRKSIVESLNEMEQAKQREVKKVALEQPHRRGLPDPESRWAENALGRFCLVHKLRAELYEAGHEWGLIVHRLEAESGAPGSAVFEGVGTGEGPSPATVARWKAMRREWNRGFDQERGGADARRVVYGLCLGNQDPHPNDKTAAILGLEIVGRAIGHKMPRHPFI